MPDLPFVTAERAYTYRDWGHLTPPERAVRRFWPTGIPKFVPTGIAKSPKTIARLEHGRWIVDCPLCETSAQFASESDPRFFCVACLNVDVRFSWIEVVWPAKRAAIERELAKRPRLDNRNWRPHETVADLRAENAAHGVS